MSASTASVEVNAKVGISVVAFSHWAFTYFRDTYPCMHKGLSLQVGTNKSRAEAEAEENTRGWKRIDQK